MWNISLIVVLFLLFCNKSFACYDINNEINKSEIVGGRKKIFLPKGDIYFCKYPSVIDGFYFSGEENFSLDIFGDQDGSSNIIAANSFLVNFENIGAKKIKISDDSVYGVVEDGKFISQENIVFSKYHYIDSGPVRKSNSSVYVEDNIVGYLSDKKIEDLYLVVDHGWESSRHKIESIDGNLIKFKPSSRHFIGEKAGIQNFYIYGASDGRPTMGQWRKCSQGEGCIEILPRKSDVGMSGELIVPINKNILTVKNIGKKSSRIVEFKLHNVGFVGGGCNQVSNGYPGEQSGFRIDATLMVFNSENFYFSGGKFSSGLCSAVRIDDKSRGIIVEKLIIDNMGGGGIYVGGQYNGEITAAKSNASIVVRNNIISNLGMIFEGASAIWVGDAGGVVVDGNEISNLGYTGISIGGRWGYGQNNSLNNVIKNNKITAIGRGRLSDMGGIYTVGEASGLVISDNVINGVIDYGKYAAGAWCLYLDEGSTGVKVLNNNLKHCSSGGIGVHYGKDIDIGVNYFSTGVYRKIFIARTDLSEKIIFNGSDIVDKRSKYFEFVDKVSDIDER